MLTLKQIRKMVEISKETKRVPSAKQLMEMGSPVLAKETIREDTSITVFKNGYVLYQDGKRATVFPLPQKKDYVYDFATDRSVLDSDLFEDENWYVRLILEGEDRLSENQRKRDNECSLLYYNDLKEDASPDLKDSTLGALEQIVAEEMFEELLGMMTEQQRIAVYAYYVEEMQQADIARMIGVSQQRASFLIRRGIMALRREFDLEDGQLVRKRSKKN